MRIIRILSIAASAAIISLSVASCGIYGKYKSETDPQLAGYEVPTYKDIFSDAKLQELIDTALAHNLDLMIAHEHVAQAEALLTSAKLAYLPNLNIGGTPAVVPNFENGKASLAFTAGTASWEIDVFGRLTNRKRIANATRDEMLDLEQACRAELISAVATAYYNLRMIEAQIAATNQAESNWKSLVSAMRDMKEAGIEDEAGVSQFEGSYYSTSSTGKALRILKEKTQASIKLLLCCNDIDLNVAPLSAQTVSEINMTALDTINLNAVRLRPDVRAAEMRLANAFYNVNLARANCCPNISIGGTVGWANGGLIYSAIGNLLQPLFNAGANAAALKVNKSRYEEYKDLYAKALLTAGTEVNASIEMMKMYKDQLGDFTNGTDAMLRALEATQLKLKYGRGTYLEVLMAQNSLLDSQIGEYQCAANIISSAIKLYQELGGGR